MSCRSIILLLVVLAVLHSVCESRYLPTRSQDDRLDRLRELLRDLLETEVEKTNMNSYDRRMMYKREAPKVLTLDDVPPQFLRQ